MSAVDLLNLLIAVLLLAGVYAAMSVGMTIIYGVMKIVNLAHAGFLMLGAYFVYELHAAFGIDPLGGLEFVLHKTWFGRGVRALMQNSDAGRIVGVNVEATVRVAFGVGIAFAGAAGGLLAMLYSFSPDFGGPFLLRAFVIIVLGGLESFAGVAVGALILAVVETFSILVLPASYQPAIAFSLLVVALIVLPEGVAGLWNKRRRWA